jgi:hypothetical protein
MPQSDHFRLRRFFRRLMGWLPRPARKEPEPPVDPYTYVTAPKEAAPVESQRGRRG